MGDTETQQYPGKKKKFIIAGGVLTVAIAGIFLYRLYVQNPQVTAAKEVHDTIAEVSGLIVLPTDEEPAVGTIVDLSALAGQPFFADAALGDKILFYPHAGRIILYSASLHKILGVAPLSIGTSVIPTETQSN